MLPLAHFILGCSKLFHHLLLILLLFGLVQVANSPQFTLKSIYAKQKLGLIPLESLGLCNKLIHLSNIVVDQALLRLNNIHLCRLV